MPPPFGHEPYNVNGEGGVKKIYTKEYIEAEADALELWMQNPSNIFFKKFTLSRGYAAQRLTEFAKENVRFAEVYSRLKDWQESRFLLGGLSNEFNAKIVALGLSHHHGYSEKSEQKISGDSVNPLSLLVENASGKSRDLITNEEQ